MPAWGGAPRQLTFYNDVGPMPPRGGWDDWVHGLDARRQDPRAHEPRALEQPHGAVLRGGPEGGLETPLELPEGGSASLSADGTKHRLHAGRPRVPHLEAHARRPRAGHLDLRLRGQPLGAPHRRPRHRQLPDVGRRHRLLHLRPRAHAEPLRATTWGRRRCARSRSFTDYDVLWPSLGPGRHRLHERRPPAPARPRHRRRRSGSRSAWARPSTPLAPHFKDVTPGVVGRVDLSPTGARVVVEARGEVFTVPAKEGAPRNLTETPGVREMSPTWSPGRAVDRLPLRRHRRIRDLRAPAGRRRGAAAHHRRRRLALRRRCGAPTRRSSPSATGSSACASSTSPSGAITDADRGTREDLDVYRLVAGQPLARLREDRTTTRHPRPRRLLPRPQAGVPARRRAHRGLVAGLQRGRQVPLLPQQPRLQPDLQRLRVRLPLHGRDAHLRRRPHPGRARRCSRRRATRRRRRRRRSRPTDREARPRRRAPSPSPKPAPGAVPVTVVAEGFVGRTTTPPGVQAPASYRGLAATADALFYIRAGRATPTPRSCCATTSRSARRRRSWTASSRYVLSPRRQEAPLPRQGRLVPGRRQGRRQGRRGKIDLARLKVKADLRAEWAQMFEDALAHRARLVLRPEHARRGLAGHEDALRRAGALRRPPRPTSTSSSARCSPSWRPATPTSPPATSRRCRACSGGMLGAELVADRVRPLPHREDLRGRELGRRLPLAAHRGRACA